MDKKKSTARAKERGEQRKGRRENMPIGLPNQSTSTSPYQKPKKIASYYYICSYRDLITNSRTTRIINAKQEDSNPVLNRRQTFKI